jgi:hypothetical protein
MWLKCVLKVAVIHLWVVYNEQEPRADERSLSSAGCTPEEPDDTAFPSRRSDGAPAIRAVKGWTRH